MTVSPDLLSGLRKMFHLEEKASSSFIYGIFLIKLSFFGSLTADWSYEDQESWNVQCGGTRQSPIDIPRRGRYGFYRFSSSRESERVCLGLPRVEFAPLMFAYYDIAPETMRIRNTGED